MSLQRREGAATGPGMGDEIEYCRHSGDFVAGEMAVLRELLAEVPLSGRAFSKTFCERIGFVQAGQRSLARFGHGI